MREFAWFGLGIPELVVLAVMGVLVIVVLVIVLTVLLWHKGGGKLPIDEESDRDGD